MLDKPVRIPIWKRSIPKDSGRQDRWRRATGSFLGHSMPGVVLGLIIAYLTMAGIIDMAVARVILITAWVLAVVQIAITDCVYTKRLGARIVIIVLFAGAFGYGGVALDRWASRKSVESKQQERFDLASELAKKIPSPPEVLTNAAILSFGTMCDGCCSKPQTLNLAGVRPGDAPAVSLNRLQAGLQQAPIVVPKDNIVQVSVCNLSGHSVTFNSVPVTASVTRRR